MKTLTILAAIVALLLTGCGANEEAGASKDVPSTPQASSETTTVVAYELGTKQKGDMGVCVICNAKEGTTAEEQVAETLDYEGKTYIFCNESEKAEFIADPGKYAKK